MTSKQRSYLRGLANKIEPIMQIGKFGVTPEVTKAVDEALEARELIKISVLNNSLLNVGEAADIIHERTRSAVVTVIGSKFVLYRRSKENPVIELPK